MLYQFAEYISAQCLRRRFQSKFTKKVNCLSGCNQLIKVCQETCGEAILTEFNKKPVDSANITEIILSTASEDRNHVTLMFKLYPEVKTLQESSAIVYTNVPTRLKKFLIQRKRWSLGAFFNDLLLIINRKHNFVERLTSFVNVFTYIINPFIIVASGQFLYAIIEHPNMLMLFLSIIMFQIVLHNLITPLVFYNLGGRIGYYYLGLLIYYCAGIFLTGAQYIYTGIYLDNFNWNKKEIVDKNKENQIKDIAMNVIVEENV